MGTVWKSLVKYTGPSYISMATDRGAVTPNWYHRHLSSYYAIQMKKHAPDNETSRETRDNGNPRVMKGRNRIDSGNISNAAICKVTVE